MNPIALLAALLASLVCAPVFAGDAPLNSGRMGIQVDIPVAQAIPLLDQKKKEMVDEHRRMVRKMLDTQKLRRWRAQNGDRWIKRFVDDVHAGVIDKLKNGNLETVSATEVEKYPKAFHADVKIILDAYRAEKRQDGRLAPVDWGGIMAKTAPDREKVIKDFADREGDRSVIAMLDGKVTDALTEKTKPEPGGGGGGSYSPSQGAANSIVFGDIDGAEASLDQAIKSGRADGGVYALRGEMALNDGRFPMAYQDARQALRMDPANKAALAVAQFAAGRVGALPNGEASAAAGAAASSEPSGARFFMGGSAREASSGSSSRRSAEQFARLGENALRLGDTAGAKAYADRGLSASPGDAYLLALRSAIHLRLREYDKAAADAQLGLQKDPKNLTLLRAKAFAENRAKKWRDALATANQILELSPSDAYGYAYRAHAYGGLGDRDAMMADLARAAELDARFADAARQAAGLQLPSNADVLFLFPGEAGPAGADAPVPGGRNRRFGLLVGVSAFGGLLLAFGLLRTVLAPLKEKVSSVFTKITRARPAVRAAESEAGASASTSGRLPGLIRGQYEVSRRIGAGGMGMVFEGTDRSLGRRVAIKKMRDEIRSDARERARFVTEAKTVAALHHVNIVDIYAIAEDGEDVFLVFEYVDGKTVHELVQSNGGLDAFATGRIVREVAAALDYAHSRGIIHRDMKPSNVMVDAQGRVKVMDFGIARAAKDALTRYSVTNTVVGTPPYMAPEQEQGQVRRESDVYSLAVCAYEMLTGKLPFAGTGGGMMLSKINMSYIPPSRQKEDLPAALDGVFERAFQADPDQRHRTPGEFSAALAAALPASFRA